jgi:phosphoserine phosphatase
MTHVVTLVSSPDAAALTSALLLLARETLPNPGRNVWLDDGVAADLFFTPVGNPDPRGFADGVRHALGNAPIDVIVQPTAKRQKKLFLADMDSTMIGQECIDELADLAGFRAQVSALTERAMRGEIDFEPALRERVALLKSLPVSTVEEVIRNRISLSPGGRTLLATLRAKGTYAVLVSGGFTLFTGPIAAALGFDEHHGNELDMAEGRFLGTLRSPILGREAKLERLLSLRDTRGLAREDTLAIGDGANDLAMLQEAGLGVAYRAKPAVAAAADARLEHADLTALLYAQGYRGSEFTRL